MAAQAATTPPIENGHGVTEGDINTNSSAPAAVLGQKQQKNKKKSASDKGKDHGPKGNSTNTNTDKKRKGGPSKKTIAAIQEAIQKVKAEEEKQLKEEDEKFKREEEAEDARLQKLRLEQERKDRKKLKEKEKKERLKAEGKFLTQKQKEKLALAKQRTEEMLQALKIQGAKLPASEAESTVVEKKPPRLGTRIRAKKSSCSESCDQPDSNSSNNNSNASSMEEAEPAEAESSPEVNKNETSGYESSEEAKGKAAAVAEAEKEKENEEGVQTWDQPKAMPTAFQISKKRRNSSGPSSRSINGGPPARLRSSVSFCSSDGSEFGETKTERALGRIQLRREENEKEKSVNNLRSPVVCVLGHVDTGKTKILDKLRRTHVQDGEAGGITQQIGATNVPIEAIQDQAKFVQGFAELEMKLPGLLVIDTPGHESFSNLRSRGSSLCDIAILVVDIMHGIEQQTLESINLLKSRKTPFVVALNKIDRIYQWNSDGGGAAATKDIREILRGQNESTLAQFEKKTNEVVAQFALQGLNVALLGQNPDPKTYVTMVPTSAVTGEGMWNLIALIVEFSQTMLAKRLMYSKELLATVLEVKQIPGLGTTIDVILLNGTLAEGQTLVLAGNDGPIVTQIRSLLTPHPMKELRVKNPYIEFKEISGAIGVKLAAKDLEKAIAGFNVLVAHYPDEVEVCKEEIAKELKSALHSIRVQERGVYVQASTLGSLEALLEFLNTSSIPYAGVKIGPVVRKDVMKASIMLEHENKYATILAFDVKIEKDAQELADNIGVRIFHADIIYHLFDQFTAFVDDLKLKERNERKHLVVYPCKLKILPECVFKNRDPIVVGVNVEAGSLHVGTPLCVVQPDADGHGNEIIDLGRVASIESNHKAVESARKGQEVCIKIESPPGDAPKALGRHFQETEPLLSRISRDSIDVCKEYFRDELDKADWHLIVELKKTLHIL